MKGRSGKMHCRSLVMLLWAGVLLSSAGCNAVFTSRDVSGLGIRQQTFADLAAIKNAKRKEIERHFQEIREVARGITDDAVMVRGFFSLQRGANGASREYEVAERYATVYGDFYDILFVDAGGYVFHSVKKERDYHTSLFAAPLAGNPLAKALQRPGDEHFVGFSYYQPSDEPAAFFTVSVQGQGRHLGWFVLQVATNSTNQILADRDTMGRTGEVYLVNQESLMLSDSRFMEDSTILRQKVDTVAVREALRRNSGDSIITDYRGVRVFSSYERFEVLGVAWVIIAEIDEDEVLTECYKRHKNFLQGEILRYLSRASRPVARPRPEEFPRQRVDMNEFARAQAGKLLVTSGVASCTAIAISYPGRFGYLAHISPTDEIYQDGALTKLILGRHSHNFLAALLAKIEFFEVYPAEQRQLRVAIIAPHGRSFGKAVDAVLAHNLDLANITFLYAADAQQGEVVIDASGSRLDVRWTKENQAWAEDGLQRENLAEILKKIIRYDV